MTAFTPNQLDIQIKEAEKTLTKRQIELRATLEWQLVEEQRSLLFQLRQQREELIENIPEFSLIESGILFPAKLFVILTVTELCKSGGDARKTMQCGGVSLEGERIMDINFTIQSPIDLEGKVLQVGKNKFVHFIN